ncbi:hypothetical protein, partial [Sinorhizobium meliloti]|uniref:hypothetical protein n=1 Tax=Rhizobium meliloti TaxID=382 RepID=UPI001AEC8BD6
ARQVLFGELIWRPVDQPQIAATKKSMGRGRRILNTAIILDRMRLAEHSLGFATPGSFLCWSSRAIDIPLDFEWTCRPLASSILMKRYRLRSTFQFIQNLHT